MYFSIKGRSVVLFLLSPVGPFKVTTNLFLFNLSILPNDHNCFSTQPLLNLRPTITVSSTSTTTCSPTIESWLLNRVSLTSEQNDNQSTDVLEEMLMHSKIIQWSQIWLKQWLTNNTNFQVGILVF